MSPAPPLIRGRRSRVWGCMSNDAPSPQLPQFLGAAAPWPRAQAACAHFYPISALASVFTVPGGTDGCWGLLLPPALQAARINRGVQNRGPGQMGCTFQPDHLPLWTFPGGPAHFCSHLGGQDLVTRPHLPAREAGSSVTKEEGRNGLGVDN